MKIQKIKQFTNGFVMAIELNDGKLIETTATCLPIETELRGMSILGQEDRHNVQVDNRIKNSININEFWNEKVMIGISTQAGCPIKCKFCEVNNLTEKQGWRNLTLQEMKSQIELAIVKIKELYGITINNPKLLRILFTRMGEPSLNIDNVMKTIEWIKFVKFKNYDNIRVQISTIGLKEKTIELIRKLTFLENKFNDYNFIEYQFSIHSTDDNFRKWLQSKNVMTNNEINRIIRNEINNFDKRKWKVTLNFTLTDKTPFNIEDLKSQFDSDKVFIKLSPLNENGTSDKNHLISLIPQYNKI